MAGRGPTATLMSWPLRRATMKPSAAARRYRGPGSGSSDSRSPGHSTLWRERATVTAATTAAVTHFTEAARRYAEAGEEHLAAESRRHRDEAAQRKAPNADTRLEQLLAELERLRPPSTARANTLVELAKLAHGNHDDFEAERWLRDAIAELAGLGYPIPEGDGVRRHG